MTLDLSKIKSDAEIIASRCDMLLMTLSVRDVLGMLAEIERIQMVSRLSCNHDGYMAVLNEIDQLKAENEALRKDADRYRFFKQSSDVIPSDRGDGWTVIYLDNGAGGFGGGVMHAEISSLDEAIDFAMTKERP